MTAPPAHSFQFAIIFHLRLVGRQARQLAGMGSCGRAASHPHLRGAFHQRPLAQTRMIQTLKARAARASARAPRRRAGVDKAAASRIRAAAPTA